MARPASYDRDAALDAAMDLFWVQGFHATSLKDLERALSMGPGSIYGAFHSKEALFSAALDRYAARMQSELSDLVANSASPLGALLTHLESLSELAPCDRPSTACMLVKSLLEMPRDGALRQVVTQHLDQVEALLTDVLKQAKAAGELPANADPDRIARRFQTYIFGLKIQAQRETNPEKLRTLCADLAQEFRLLSRAA